jgi:type I restriction enzyme M protein
MLTGEVKNKVDKIWEIFWTGGITNPLTVIEQFTYLLFIKGLDDRQSLLEADAEILGLDPEKIFNENQQDLRWKNFRQKPSQEMFRLFTDPEKGIFNFIKNLDDNKNSAFSKYMREAIFMIPTPSMLEKIVTAIDSIQMQDTDFKGDLYEYLLSKVATSGTNGQFRTPRHIINLMVELMKPNPHDTITDPAAGTSGFLVSSGEYIQKHHKELFNDENLKKHYNQDMFFGFDMDATMLRIGAMNMMLHGVERPNIMYRDSLSDQNPDRETSTLILANPPFKGSLDFESVSDDLLKITKTKKTELLFIALMILMLKKGGRCATIVPDGVLFGGSNAHKKLRQEIIENHNLKAVISMPSGVFKPYAGVSTAIIIFEKTGIGGTENVWFYNMTSDGFTLDDKRQKTDSNDIPDIIKRFENLENETNNKRTEKSFMVLKDEIVKNDYDLSINRYREIEYEEVDYEKPLVILDRVKKIEMEIIEGIDELRGLVG